MKRRNLPMEFTPQVEGSYYGQLITVVTGCHRAGTEYKFKGSLSPECAAELVRNLRRALRKIRDDSANRLNRAVTSAEGDL